MYRTNENKQEQMRYRMTPQKFIKKCDISLKDCQQLGGLINTGDSCYLDSVLFALLAIPNKFVNKYILLKKITNNKSKSFLELLQKYLIYLTEEIRIKNTFQVCTPFRNIIKKHQVSGMPNFSLPGQQEAGDEQGHREHQQHGHQLAIDLNEAEDICNQIKSILSNSDTNKPIENYQMCKELTNELNVKRTPTCQG